MCSIQRIPPEILDRVFRLLTTADRKQAARVCSQWNAQLSTLSFSRESTLRLRSHSQWHRATSADLLAAISRSRFQCIALDDRFATEGSSRHLDMLAQLLLAGRLTVQELSLESCSQECLGVVFATVGQMRRLRQLRIDYRRASTGSSCVSLPSVPADLTGFASLKQLEVSLINASFVVLVERLASQLTHLTLTVHRKDLLVRCLNAAHLTALRSLTLVTSDSAEVDLVQPGELGDSCRRTLAELHTFRCVDATLLYLVLAELLRHCRNLKCLAIEDCNISEQCVDVIGTLDSLQDLRLNVFRHIGGSKRRGPATLNLPKLERIALSTENTVRLGEQMTRLNSVEITNLLQSPCPKKILAEIHRLVANEGTGRRLQKLHFKSVVVDRESASCLVWPLSIDELCFEGCEIDGSFLELLTNGSPKNIARVTIDACLLVFDGDTRYEVETVAELRARSPSLQLAISGTQLVKVHR